MDVLQGVAGSRNGKDKDIMCIRIGSSHLMWDNIGTVHNAVGDYTAGEPRCSRRVQMMATLDYPRLVA